MTLDTSRVSSMYAQIVNGLPKEKSQHVSDAESSAMWDKIAGEVEQMRAETPGIVFSIPNEMPDIDDDDEEPEAPPAPAPDDVPDPDAEEEPEAAAEEPEQPEDEGAGQ